MAPPPKNTPLNREDIPDAPSWFEKVSQTVNPFIQGVSQALAKRLTRAENLASQVKVITVTVPTPVDDLFPLRFKSELPAPYALWIGQVQTISGGGTNGGVSIGSWSLTQDGQIQIDFIDGLLSAAKYRITFIVE